MIGNKYFGAFESLCLDEFNIIYVFKSDANCFILFVVARRCDTTKQQITKESRLNHNKLLSRVVKIVSGVQFTHAANFIPLSEGRKSLLYCMTIRAHFYALNHRVQITYTIFCCVRSEWQKLIRTPCQICNRISNQNLNTIFCFLIVGGWWKCFSVVEQPSQMESIMPCWSNRNAVIFFLNTNPK